MRQQIEQVRGGATEPKILLSLCESLTSRAPKINVQNAQLSCISPNSQILRETKKKKKKKKKSRSRLFCRPVANECVDSAPRALPLNRFCCVFIVNCVVPSHFRKKKKKKKKSTKNSPSFILATPKKTKQKCSVCLSSPI